MGRDGARWGVVGRGGARWGAMGRGGCVLERRKNRSSKPPAAVSKLGHFRSPQFVWEIQKAVDLLGVYVRRNKISHAGKWIKPVVDSTTLEKAN